MKSNEKWVFITGASSGIGRSLALQFSKLGHPLIIHGQNQEALFELSTLLKTPTKIFRQDLTQEDAISKTDSYYKEQGISPSIIVNNAGFGVGGNFKDSDLDKEFSMLEIHIRYPLSLIKWFIQQDSTHKRYILNTSSLYAFFPVARQSVYSSSKAFIHHHSLAISSELKEQNISITSLCPGLTYSNFRINQGKPEKKIFFGMSADRVAQIAVKATFNENLICVPGLYNKLMAFILPKIPYSLVAKIMSSINKARGL